MGDTIVITTNTPTVLEVSGRQGPQGPAGAAGATGPQGPQGVPGTGLEVLTTQGDLLYQGAETGQRLAIGTTGQILKVSAGGIPEWGAAPATGVTSVTGTAPITSSGGNTPTISISEATTSAAGSMSAADKSKLNNAVETSRTISAGTGLTGGGDLSANRTLSVSFGSSAGTATEGNDARLSDSRNPLAHKASHATGGADALAPSDIGAQSIFSVESLVITTTSQVTLTAARAKIYDIVQYAGAQVDVKLPSTNAIEGDIVVMRWGTGGDSIRIIQSSSGSPLTTVSSGEQKRFIRGATDNWTLVPVDTHTHAASAITSGALTHERGGLEADVSAYSGLVKISGGSTSAVTVTAAGEALLDDATNADQRTTLGLGTAAVANLGTGATDAAYGNHTHGNITNGGLVGTTSGLPLKTGTGGIVEAGAFGTSAGTFAAGDHTHAQLHDKSHTMTDATSHSAGNWKLFYSDGAGAVQELALASTAGHVLQSNGATSAPSFAAASGGVGGGTGSTDNAILRADGTGGATAQSSDINILDATTSTQNNVAITNEHSGQTNSSLVFCNKGTGAFIVSPARPDATSSGGNARGTSAVCIVPTRNNANQVASGASAIAVGERARSAANNTVAIGTGSVASSNSAVALGPSCSASSDDALSIGQSSSASGAYSIAIGNGGTAASAFVSTAIGRAASASQSDTIAIGRSAAASAVNATAIGGVSTTASLRSQFATPNFSSVYWSGQTTTNAATILNLDGTATNRFTIAASTALAVDILLVARRTGTQDKWLVARRFLGIRRDGSNNTSLIGAVQTLGTDQSEGSPTWTFSLTADDTNEALQLEVTGASGETVEWRATAFYRVA